MRKKYRDVCLKCAEIFDECTPTKPQFAYIQRLITIRDYLVALLLKCPAFLFDASRFLEDNLPP